MMFKIYFQQIYTQLCGRENLKYSFASMTPKELNLFPIGLASIQVLPVKREVPVSSCSECFLFIFIN